MGMSRQPRYTQTDIERLPLTCERLGLDPLSGEAYLAEVPRAPAQVLVGLGDGADS